MIDDVNFHFCWRHQIWFLVWKLYTSHVTRSTIWSIVIISQETFWWKFQLHTVSRTRDFREGVPPRPPFQAALGIIRGKLHEGLIHILLSVSLFMHFTISQTKILCPSKSLMKICLSHYNYWFDLSNYVFHFKKFAKIWCLNYHSFHPSQNEVGVGTHPDFLL